VEQGFHHGKAEPLVGGGEEDDVGQAEHLLPGHHGVLEYFGEKAGVIGQIQLFGQGFQELPVGMSAGFLGVGGTGDGEEGIDSGRPDFPGHLKGEFDVFTVKEFGGVKKNQFPLERTPGVQAL